MPLSRGGTEACGAHFSEKLSCPPPGAPWHVYVLTPFAVAADAALSGFYVLLGLFSLVDGPFSRPLLNIYRSS